ncbi:MAG: hypothetical protein L3J17_15890 [Candidatus Jettenia sp.]|nr:MAG: hypothetical protein L3J17_15890 [Candidatus Jettenia sp.]
MFNLQTEIGTARDNFKSPVHNWYKFTAGFSYKFIDEIITLENLNFDHKIFDPFAGCGTTLVSAQKKGIPAVGNEGQNFMYEVIQAKLNWNLCGNKLNEHLKNIQIHLKQRIKQSNIDNVAHPLLKTLYEDEILKELYLIKDYLTKIKCERSYYLFFKLALSQTLHKVSKHPISIPYISRNKRLINDSSGWETFNRISLKMLEDTKEFKNFKKTSKIYFHDSRKCNNKITEKSCNICITSPPYLNNLDYGEISKVHSHFFGITSSWNDITNKVRKKLVIGATTHYSENQFNLHDWKTGEFYQNNKTIGEDLIEKAIEIKEISKNRLGKKSYDILLLYYFQDMHNVLKEIRRILKQFGKVYMILGDSAPYGVLISTTDTLGKIAINVGFNGYEIHRIRARGTKWRSLKYRHSLELTENVLILK